MLTLDELKVIVTMIHRAQCTGDEATAVAVVLNKLNKEGERLSQPRPEVVVPIDAVPDTTEQD